MIYLVKALLVVLFLTRDLLALQPDGSSQERNLAVRIVRSWYGQIQVRTLFWLFCLPSFNRSVWPRTDRLRGIRSTIMTDGGMLVARQTLVSSARLVVKMMMIAADLVQAWNAGSVKRPSLCRGAREIAGLVKTIVITQFRIAGCPICHQLQLQRQLSLRHTLRKALLSWSDLNVPPLIAALTFKSVKVSQSML